MDKVRFGVIGLGNIGGTHIAGLKQCSGAELTAVCDIDKTKAEKIGKELNLPSFDSHRKLLESGLVDAITIGTPHYDHPPIALDAFAKGVHVMCEKPVAVSVKAARDLNEQWEKKYKHLKFVMMFQLRTMPIYAAVKKLIADGELGEISRITFYATDQFRTWAYYASGGWRATWKGEGGGVLLNQCPHYLDLLQWIPNMVPRRVTATATIAKTHPIEVEDEVQALLEYDNGAIGQFVTTTGECPGTSRIDIAGDRGKVVIEKNKITFSRTRKSVQEVNRTTPEIFTRVETWDIDIPYNANTPSGHKVVLQNFTNYVLKDEQPIAHGTEGIRSLEIGNAMLMSGITRRPIELPMDGNAYDAFMGELIRKYSGKKTLSTQEKTVDADGMVASWKK